MFAAHGLTQLKAGAFQAVNVCTVHSDHVSLFKTLLGITRALNAKAVADALPAVNLTAEQKNKPLPYGTCYLAPTRPQDLENNAEPLRTEGTKIQVNLSQSNPAHVKYARAWGCACGAIWPGSSGKRSS